MKYEVYIDMKNENALCTISMLSALLENQEGDYYNLLIPFLLHSLPEHKDAEISVENTTMAMREFGFVDFPYKLTERMLNRLSRRGVKGEAYVRFKIKDGKKRYFVERTYDKTKFDANRLEMRKKINAILDAIQKYFETHFYCKTIPIDDVREKLTAFFSANGFAVIKSVDELRLISKENGSDSFQIAHFILEEYEKKSVIYDDMCDVTKGFLTYKGLYYFLSDRKNHVDSKFKNVTFYLDCSLVLDALDYDTSSDYNAINELIRLVRRCGGQVAVFRHTVDEAARLIEAFASQPYNRNSFRLDNLAAKNFTREMLFAIAKDIPQTLQKRVQVDVVDPPSFTDVTNYKNILGEEEIVSWFSLNRQNGNAFDSEDERYRFDAKSIIAIGMCRRDYHPHYIEQARAMIVTQDPWLNRCLKDVYKDKFKNEVLYAITDTELVSLLWLRDHKQVSNLPSDILIANAHAACRVSTEVMDRAVEIANAMVDNGTIPSDAALLVSSHPEFKRFIANRFQNDASRLNNDSVRLAIEEYISSISREEVEAVRNNERKNAQENIEEQRRKYAVEKETLKARILEQEDTIQRLTKEIHTKTAKEVRDKEMATKKRCARAEKKAKIVRNITWCLLYSLSLIFAVTLVLVFGVKCYQSYINEGAWLPYMVVEVIAFISIPLLFVSKKSVNCKLINRLADKVYMYTYSKYIEKQK